MMMMRRQTTTTTTTNEDDGEGAGLELMQGMILLDGIGKLVLKGEGFSLQSMEPFDSSSVWSFLLLHGPWQLATADLRLKDPPRQIKLSIATVCQKIIVV
jgi:hypothetical protein